MYRGLFWGFYKGQMAMWNPIPAPTYAAALLFSTFEYLFLFNVALVCELFSVKIVPRNVSAYVYDILFLSGLFLNYYFLASEKRIDSTIQEFTNNPEIINRRWIYSAYLVLIITIILFIVLIIILRLKR